MVYLPRTPEISTTQIKSDLNLQNIYDKYISRGGEPVFDAENTEECIRLLDEIYRIADSADYIRDMKINEKLGSLLTIIMSRSWHPENSKQALKRQEIGSIKAWIDEHYKEKSCLTSLQNSSILTSFICQRYSKRNTE